ncbi:MAG: class I SAM-dependent RNA methyltransferase [Spirochaetales bacterium]|nr:class I SAM-dependent RNA methyltransferase [Spirochaetales bacterium]
MKRRIELTIDKMVAKGEALARHEGKAIFIPGAIPGERLLVELTEERRDFSRAKIVEILEASKERITPRCPYYGRCGGCDFQFVDNSSQVAFKEAIVLENLERIGKIDTSKIEFKGSVVKEEWGYRNRVRFHTQGNKVGFLARQSKTLVPIDHCLVLCDQLNLYLGEKRGEVLKQKGGSVHALAGDSEVTFSRRPVALTVGEKTLYCDAKAFFQSNYLILPELVNYVKEAVVGEKVLDLYSGVGTFAAFLEGQGREVIAVERDRRCLELAKRNLKETQFVPLPLEMWVKGGDLPQVDTIVVDPPRVGLEREVLNILTTLGASTIVYVSCDSVTLSRDLKLFATKGYHTTTLKLFDMYPQTSHIEAVVLMSKIEK